MASPFAATTPMQVIDDELAAVRERINRLRIEEDLLIRLKGQMPKVKGEVST